MYFIPNIYLYLACCSSFYHRIVMVGFSIPYTTVSSLVYSPSPESRFFYTWNGRAYQHHHSVCHYMVVLSHNHTSTLLLFPTGTSIRHTTSEEFEKVSAIFTSTWDKQKSSCHKVDCVFVVSNSALKKRWNTYRKQLQGEHQTVEKHFHGTTLVQNHTHSSALY